MLVDLLNVLAELGASWGIDSLDLLEATTLDECSLGLQVLWENLGELGAHIGEDVVWSQLEEWLEGWNVGAHLDDVLEGLLGLVLEVGGGLSLLHHVHGQEMGWHISLSQELGVVWGVSSDHTKGPGGGGLEVVLWLVDEGILEWGNSLGDNNSHGKGVIEGGDVTEGHDTWESGIALGLTDVVDSGGGSTRVDDELGKLWGLLGNLTDAGGSVLAHLDINVLETVEDPWEDLSLNDDLSKVDGVLGDLGEALAHVSLELSIWVGDEGGEVWDGASIDDSLSELLGVLGDLRESGGGDSLQGELWLLNAEDKETNGSSVNDGLSQVMVVLGDAGEGKGSSLLDGWVELLKAVDEGVKGSRVDDSLGEVWRVLGHGSKNVGGSFLVEALKSKNSN